MAVTLFRNLSYLGFARETTQGTGVAPTSFVVLQKQAFVPSQKIAEFRTGNQRDLSFAVKESFSYAGSFQTFLYADEGANLLALAMGKDTKTGAGDPYTHTLSFVEPLPYATFEAAFYEGQIIDRVTDCKIVKTTIDWEAAKEMMLTCDLVGSTVAVQGSAATVTFNNAVGVNGPLMGYNGVFTLTGPTDVAVVQAQIMKAQIVIDQGVVPVYGPGQITPIALFEEARKVSYKLDLRFSGPNLHDLIYYGASNGTTPSAVIGTGSFQLLATAQVSPEHSIQLNSANMWWERGDPQFSPDGKTGIVSVEAVAYRSGATLPFTAIAKNAVATAYTA